VATVAVVIVNLASGRLLRVQAQLGVRFAALDIAGAQHRERRAGGQSGWYPICESQCPYLFAAGQGKIRESHVLFVSFFHFGFERGANVRTYNDKGAMAIALKRVYKPTAAADGYRVLVDRLWPRGLNKSRAAVDEWLRDLAPSNDLRKWFHAHTEEWALFRKRYLEELAGAETHEALQRLRALSRSRKRLTLLYSSRNEGQNNAVVLRDLLDGPQTSTGSAKIRNARRWPEAPRS
jgi:uncharacterized protein YeaO (DUF488 family)